MNNRIYKALVPIALAGGYTQAQAATVTRSQITTVTGRDASTLTDAELDNFRSHLIGEMKKRDNEGDKVFVLDQLDGGVRVAFKNRFPDAVLRFKMLHLDGTVKAKRAIIIWPDGEPEIETGE